MCLQFKIRVYLLIIILMSITLNSAVIQLKSGLISGEDLDYYVAYRSIPYAQPPVGSLRFESPQPYVATWPGIRDATVIPPKCLQYNVLNPESPLEGQEDCLYLNVFVPKSNKTQAAMHVMVFIHGGGFMWGSADFYGEEYLMRRGNLILVTLNYRLGPFGFLSTEDAAISGNMGLKDQTLALQWVYENIAAFGGDVGKILITGWSAGGASVHYHLVSPATSSRWFRSAVSFSGTALCPCHTIYKGQALAKAQRLGSLLNCPSVENSTSSLRDCLKTKNASDIAALVPRFYEFSHHPFAIFGPVIDGHFLTDHVANLMRSGQSKGKPWLVARTAEDGAFGTVEFLGSAPGSDHLLIDDLNENWLKWAPTMLFLNASADPKERQRLAADLRRQFFGAQAISLKTYGILQELYNTELSTKHVEETVRLYATYTQHAQAYGYVYDNPPVYGFGQLASGRNDTHFGTIHGDDLFLIFDTPVRRSHPFSQAEEAISQNLIEMLHKFATTGIPQYAGQSLRQLKMENKFEFNVITGQGMK